MTRKETIQIGIIAVLSILLLLGIGSLFKKVKRGPGQNVRPTIPAAKSGDVAVTAKTATPIIAAVSRYELKRKTEVDDNFLTRFSKVADTLPLERDPFAIGRSGPQKPEDELVLEGVMWDEKKPTAIINQTLVSEGDTIGEFQVVKIQQTSARLKGKTSEFELQLNKTA